LNHERLRKDRNLVCTCNEIYKSEISEIAADGCEDAEELMYARGAFFKCMECKAAIERLIQENKK